MKHSIQWLQTCLLAVLFVVASARPLLALTPQGCEKRVVRGAVTAGQEPTGGQSEVVALHLTGSWNSEGPPTELHVRHAESGEERVLLRRGPSLGDFPRDRLVRLYQVPDGGLAAGRWQLARDDFEIWGGSFELEEDSGFYVFEPLTGSHVQGAEVDASIEELPWTVSPLRDLAAAMLVLRVDVPMGWRERVPSDALLGVRLGVDTPPDDTADLADSDRFIALHYALDAIVLRGFTNSTCFSSITTDWLDGTTLHGLLWPVGEDPAQVSMRFTVELADLRAEVTRRHNDETEAAPDAGDPGEQVTADAGNDGEAEDHDTGRNVNGHSRPSSGAGCSMLRVGSRTGSGAATAFLVGVLARRRRRTTHSQAPGST